MAKSRSFRRQVTAQVQRAVSGRGTLSLQALELASDDSVFGNESMPRPESPKGRFATLY